MTKQLESQLEAIKKQSKILSADRDYAYDMLSELEKEVLLYKDYTHALEQKCERLETKLTDCISYRHKLLMKIKELKGVSHD